MQKMEKREDHLWARSKSWKEDLKADRARFDQITRIAVLGSPNVGKTFFLNTFLNNPQGPYEPTMVDCYHASIMLEHGPCELSIVEFGGNSAEKAVCDFFLRNLDMVLLCFAVNSPPTLAAMNKWLELVRSVSSTAMCFVVGLQAHLRNHRLKLPKPLMPEEACRGSANRLGLPYQECDMTSKSVSDTFKWALQSLLLRKKLGLRRERKLLEIVDLCPLPSHQPEKLTPTGSPLPSSRKNRRSLPEYVSDSNLSSQLSATPPNPEMRKAGSNIEKSGQVLVQAPLQPALQPPLQPLKSLTDRVRSHLPSPLKGGSGSSKSVSPPEGLQHQYIGEHRPKGFLEFCPTITPGDHRPKGFLEYCPDTTASTDSLTSSLPCPLGPVATPLGSREKEVQFSPVLALWTAQKACKQTAHPPPMSPKFMPALQNSSTAEDMSGEALPSRNRPPHLRRHPTCDNLRPHCLPQVTTRRRSRSALCMEETSQSVEAALLSGAVLLRDPWQMDPPTITTSEDEPLTPRCATLPLCLGCIDVKAPPTDANLLAGGAEFGPPRPSRSIPSISHHVSQESTRSSRRFRSPVTVTRKCAATPPTGRPVCTRSPSFV
mmetsp:Transcript_51619/g.129502  ORF Transcript_51619/g.129502 Transcript_51619/m.129502 type:complete len:601 (+) Transcript_51619:102-1904(+)